MLSKTQLIRAIRDTADHIEAIPESYNFGATNTPACPSPCHQACAIGWIAHFSNIPELRDKLIYRAALVCFDGLSEGEVYVLFNCSSEENPKVPENWYHYVSGTGSAEVVRGLRNLATFLKRNPGKVRDIYLRHQMEYPHG